MAPGLETDPAGAGRSKAPDGSGAQIRRFLRYGQIFGAAVHELVGARCLAQVFHQPLTLPQLHLLKVIAHNGQQRVSDVASFLGVSAPAATKCVDKLERLGLVYRMPSSTDRRTTQIVASAEARKLVEEYERVKRRRLQPILSGFHPEEVEQLIDLLERFAVELYASEHPENRSCLWCGAYFEDDCAIAGARGGCPAQELQSPNSTEANSS